tara:strand:+ start:1588 stop:1998 length:411 start_codon:yes stop_codon:yes gene_type:complete
MVTTILLLLANHLELDISAALLSPNLLHVIGRVRNYGQAKVEARSHHQKIVKENISIFVKNNLTMKQGYNARLDESLGMKHKGAHSQSMKDRRDESKGMAKSMTGHAYSGDHSMSYNHKCIKEEKCGEHLSKLIRK